MKQTVPVNQSIAHTALGIEHTLYTNYHHITYFPIMLFIIALLVLLVSSKTKSIARILSYLVAIALVVACVFII